MALILSHSRDSPHSLCLLQPKSEKDCLDLFNDSIVQRAPSPIQQSKVAYFFRIRVSKSNSTSVAFTMVALPSTEALHDDRTQARMREGPKMNQVPQTACSMHCPIYSHIAVWACRAS